MRWLAIEAVSSLVDEVKFSIAKKGVELKVVDPANVAGWLSRRCLRLFY